MAEYSTFEKAVLIGGSVITLAIVGYLANSMLVGNRTIKRLEYVLDINRDGKLSAEEIKKFYDEMGISPYTAKNLRNVSDKDIEKFLDRYESADSKKK